jgi:ABC-type nitrate/sulfonate/bicarbonate transport system permease component
MVITVFSLLVSVIQGFESVPVEIAELTEVYAASFRRRFRMSLLPGAVASILQGLRVAAPLAVLGALLAEWLDGFDGIGSLMITASADQDIDLEMAACLVAVVLSLLSFALVELATALVARRGYRIDQMSVGRR